MAWRVMAIAAVLGGLILVGCETRTPRTMSLAEEEACLVDRVVDGDTITVVCGRTRGNVRLMGYDTPETFRPGCDAERRKGNEAKLTLARAIANATTMEPEFHGTDKYDRLLARLYLDGRNVADIMVAAGMAVPYDGGRRINWCERLGA